MWMAQTTLLAPRDLGREKRSRRLGNSRVALKSWTWVFVGRGGGRQGRRGSEEESGESGGSRGPCRPRPEAAPATRLGKAGAAVKRGSKLPQTVRAYQTTCLRQVRQQVAGWPGPGVARPGVARARGGQGQGWPGPGVARTRGGQGLGWPGPGLGPACQGSGVPDSRRSWAYSVIAAVHQGAPVIRSWRIGWSGEHSRW